MEQNRLQTDQPAAPPDGGTSAVGTSPPRLPIQARRHKFVTQLQKGLQRCGVITEKRSTTATKIIVGVSGGADSFALLLGLMSIARRRSVPSLHPIAVHVHHHLRETADADAAAVVALCNKYQIQYRVEHVHPGELTGNVSANARRLRYAALERCAVEEGAKFVAVAHHSEDQLETMLSALCRGTGLSGLAGMAWSRALDQDIALIRPMLAMSDAGCEEFCGLAGVQWCNDPTNDDVKQRRAQLRRDVLPVLKDLWPNAAKRAAATADTVRAANDIVEQQIEQVFGATDQRKWSRESLATLPTAILAAGLQRAAKAADSSVADRLKQRQLIVAAERIRSSATAPQRYHWPAGLKLEITSRSVRLKCPGDAAETTSPTNG